MSTISTNMSVSKENKPEVTLSKATVVSRLKEKDVSMRMKEADVVKFASLKKRASVLVPLILRKDGGIDVFLTVRSRHLRTDGGDVAFPGGRQDEDDADETAAALREALEEVGLHRTDVEVVSQLPPFISRSGYFITPIAALIPEEFKPNININEVEDVFRYPLIQFLQQDHHDSHDLNNSGRFAKLHYFSHETKDRTYVTYGLTAYICILTACTVYGHAPDFEMEPGFDLNNLLDPFFEYMKRETLGRLSSPDSKL